MPLREIEMMVTLDELKEFASYCLKRELKFNDWVRELAYKEIISSSSGAISLVGSEK